MTRWGKFGHLYHTNRWRKLSEAHRAREPLCRLCGKEGRVKIATVCDHVDGHPADETEAKFWAGPFQSLCAECHSGPKRDIETTGQERGCDADGWPKVEAQDERGKRVRGSRGNGRAVAR